MKKHLLFISYCQEDYELVKLLEVEINMSRYFAAYIVASKRDALKYLVEKVKEGIHASYALVPILTKKSILAQWVNQEIAIADIQGKLLFPIVEKSVIDKLKGIIHKGRDLPYSFNYNEDTAEFLDAIKKLMKDLDGSIDQMIDTIKPIIHSRSRLFDSTKERLRKDKADRIKQQFIQSHSGHKVGMDEAIKLFSIISMKAKELQEDTDYEIKVDQSIETYTILVRCENFKIAVLLHFIDNTPNLIVSYETVLLSKDLKGINESQITSYNRPYRLDKVNDIYGWTSGERQRNDFFTSEEIADWAFNWMVNELTDSSKTR